MLHLLVALRPEASPFVEGWSLRRDPDVSGFDLYEGEFGEMPVRLVRAGIGKAHMAAAVGWLAGRAGQSRTTEAAIWLNAGIAGHTSLLPGDVVMAHCVLDVASGRASYPPLVVEPPCLTCEMRTVDAPETVYQENAAYDMEASAFVDAARRFATAELVHCVKVVSDGPAAPVHQLNRQQIGQLSKALVPVVEELARRLRPVLEEVQAAAGDPPDYDQLLTAHHFTVSDQVQLRKLLRRRSALAATEPLPEGTWTASRGKEANRVLKTWLDGIASK